MIQAAVDVIDVIDVESLFPEVRKRSLESNENHQPSKILKHSGEWMGNCLREFVEI